MKRLALGLAALSLAAAAPASAAVVFFDDFEAPGNTRNWQVYPSFGDWTTTYGAGIEVQTNGTIGGVSAHSGVQYIELDSDRSRGGMNAPTNSAMTAKLALERGIYEISWYYRPRTNSAGDNLINFFFDPASAPLMATLAGFSDGVKSQVTGWVRHTVTVNAPTQGDYHITFAADGNQNTLGGFLDDVEVRAVPEPATLTLFALALMVAFSMRRRLAALPDRR